MEKIIASISDTNLNNSFITNLYAYYQHFISNEIDNSQIYESEGSSVYFSGMSSPLLNSVIQKNTITRKSENHFKKVNELFQGSKIPYHFWLNSNLDKKGADPLLKPHGYRYIGDSNGLAVELDEMGKHDSPNSLYVQKLRDLDDFNKWLDIASVHLTLRGNDIEKYRKIFQETDFTKHESWQKYIGWLNGEPIACSTLVLAGGVAAVYDDAIIPRMRRTRWGIEESMVSAPLKAAMKLGYKVGIVHSDVGDMRRYRAFGFKEVYKYPKYMWIAKR
ncbi:MAG: hypothetical protein ACXAD7_18640 [Candidatus Kariarchaeaceae archaeon]|jgi:hypothetical protein